MNRSEFLKFCENRVVFLDGATGTNLMKAGMPAGVCPEKWILEHRDVMIGLQKAYADAGSDIVYAPTFTGNRIKLADYGLADDIERINTEIDYQQKELMIRFKRIDDYKEMIKKEQNDSIQNG
jgi:5-methyltetrahydrofolate--homocysteine methyltransferase